MKISKRQLQYVIRETLLREQDGEVKKEKLKTTAGKKAESLLDSAVLNTFKLALDKANSKNAVKETLSQIFNVLSDDGKKFLKLALKELAAEL